MSTFHQDVEYVMITEQEIAEKVKAMGKTLSEMYADKNPVVICILKGSIVFCADLIREMQIPLTVDFMCVSSYGNGTKSTRDVKILKDLATDIQGRHVLIVEDIIDSGNTLYNLKGLLEKRQPASVNIVTLLDKPERRETPLTPDYTCFVIEDKFVVGYGLDYAETYRNLPYVGVLKPSVYQTEE